MSPDMTTRSDDVRSKLPDDFRHLARVRRVHALACALFPATHILLHSPRAVRTPQHDTDPRYLGKIPQHPDNGSIMSLKEKERN